MITRQVVLDDDDEHDGGEDAAKTVSVEVLAPFKVAKGGQSWRPGEIATVDEATADRWQRYGWVKGVDVPNRAHRKRSPKQPDSSED